MADRISLPRQEVQDLSFRKDDEALLAAGARADRLGQVLDLTGEIGSGRQESIRPANRDPLVSDIFDEPRRECESDQKRDERDDTGAQSLADLGDLLARDGHRAESRAADEREEERRSDVRAIGDEKEPAVRRRSPSIP